MGHTLFTPGPVNISAQVHRAMCRDVGSRSEEFSRTSRWVSREILTLCSASDRYRTVLVQGSGTFAIEATLGTLVGKRRRVLILSNGAYGDRATSIAARLGISCDVLRVPETETVDARRLQIACDTYPAADYIYVVHCETTTGIINPLPEIARFCKSRNVKLIVDAIGTIGSETIDVEAEKICAVIGSSNKCIESSPGVAFVIVDANELERSGGNPFSVSLCLFEQSRSFESTGQWRFTPPTHSVLALKAALEELEAEGGITARHARHQDKRNRIYDGMSDLGFETYIPLEITGSLILTFKTPTWPLFSFRSLFNFLSARQIEIYPGKLSDADTFRIGCIGKLTYGDVDKLLSLVGCYLSDLRRE